MTRNWLIFLFLLFLSLDSYAQTVFATESFGSGDPAGTSANGFVGDMGTWTTANTGANGVSANNWYVSGEECGMPVGSCGIACSGGNNTLHVSAIGGLCGVPDCGAAYDETFVTNQTNKRAISPTIDCAGYSNIELNFNYIAAQGDDGFWAEYSLDNGATWTTFAGGNVVESGCCCILAGFCTNFFDPTPCSDLFSGQGYWAAANLVFPVGADNNSLVKFAFHWSNDGNGIGTDPSVAIDDVTVTYGIILSTGISEFQVHPDGMTNTLNWSTKEDNKIVRFELEHSTDGRYFNTIQNVDENLSESDVNYHFTHSINSSINYYRIKTINENGEIEYSEIRRIKNEIDDIYVQTLDESFKIVGLGKYSGKIELIDLNGKTSHPTLTYSYDDNEIILNNQTLSPGLYIINIYTQDKLIKKKVLKY